MKRENLERIRQKKIITIVRGVYGDQVCGLAEALVRGGIGLMEVTFDQSHPELHERTAEAIRAVAGRLGGDMLVGAGTVTTPELVDLAREAGATYIVSPDFRPDVVRHTLALDMVSLPGAMTPTEIKQAYDCGADFVKVFPAAQLGPGYIKAVRGPLNQIPLMAVGGVNEKNAADFMRAGCCGVGVGGNLVNKEWIAGGEWDRITALAREFVEAVSERS